VTIKRVFFAGLGCLCGVLVIGALLDRPAEAESVTVPDTVKEKPLPPQPPAKPVEKADPNKPYVPPALTQKPTPESNAILPPLYGWQRIVLLDLKMPPSDEIINNCGMKRDMIFQFFASRLQEAGVPIVSDDQDARLIPDVVRIEAEPSITSMQDLVINCISYVQFRVKVDLTFRLPPLMYRRTVPVLLWNDGMMVSSAKSTHNGALINAFVTMAERFRDAWKKQNEAFAGH
jgi:hypothetical protein